VTVEEVEQQFSHLGPAPPTSDLLEESLEAESEVKDESTVQYPTLQYHGTVPQYSTTTKISADRNMLKQDGCS